MLAWGCCSRFNLSHLGYTVLTSIVHEATLMVRARLYIDSENLLDAILRLSTLLLVDISVLLDYELSKPSSITYLV